MKHKLEKELQIKILLKKVMGFMSSIMEDCNLLMNQIPQATIRHVYREANKSADWLASFGLSLDSDFVLWTWSACGPYFCSRG